MKTCDVSGCVRRTRSKNGKYCEMHYYRLRRNGSFDLLPWPQTIKQSAGYVLAQVKGHPLAKRRFREYEHRIVYYNAHGEGPFKCHWCGKEVTWETLHIDHLDDNKQNNDVNNLAATCPRCNQGRGRHKTIAARSAWLEWNGERLTVKQWAKRLGIRAGSLHWRVKHGWPVNKALTESRGRFGPPQTAMK